MFYPELIDRYRDILGCPEFCDPEHPTMDSHLVWMLNEIQYNNTQSITKKHRWLGYVQGVMTFKGYITVDDERNKTRHIFNGA